MSTLTMKASGVPVGGYEAEFVEWEQSVHEQFGDRIGFRFRVIGGAHDGTETTRFTGAKLSPKSALAKVLSGLAGQKIEVGDSVDPDKFVGKRYMVVVEETESGATRVESILPTAG